MILPFTNHHPSLITNCTLSCNLLLNQPHFPCQIPNLVNEDSLMSRVVLIKTHIASLSTLPNSCASIISVPSMRLGIPWLDSDRLSIESKFKVLPNFPNVWQETMVVVESNLFSNKEEFQRIFLKYSHCELVSNILRLTLIFTTES